MNAPTGNSKYQAGISSVHEGSLPYANLRSQIVTSTGKSIRSRLVTGSTTAPNSSQTVMSSRTGSGISDARAFTEHT